MTMMLVPQPGHSSLTLPSNASSFIRRGDGNGVSAAGLGRLGFALMEDLELQDRIRVFVESLLNLYGFQGAKRSEKSREWTDELLSTRTLDIDWDDLNSEAHEQHMEREYGELYEEYKRLRDNG